MRITADVNAAQAAKAIQKVEGLNNRLLPVLQKELQRWLIQTAGYIKEQKLTGQVLHVRSGNLRSSITPSTVLNQAGVMTGNIQAGFGNKSIIYARIHELGGVILPRKVDALKFKTDDGAWHTVKRVVMPARPYMRPAAEERRPLLLAQITEAIQAYIRGN